VTYSRNFRRSVEAERRRVRKQIDRLDALIEGAGRKDELSAERARWVRYLRWLDRFERRT
jgi:hypothetical protein